MPHTRKDSPHKHTRTLAEQHRRVAIIPNADNSPEAVEKRAAFLAAAEAAYNGGNEQKGDTTPKPETGPSMNQSL